MRGRTHSRECKMMMIVRQLASGEKRPAQVCREHNLAASRVVRWRQKYELRGEAAFAPPEPTPTQAEVVKAYVILAPGYTASPELATELQEHVKRVTAPYKYPREIEFVDTVPKTISGKIRRVELREMERQKKLGK